MLEISLGIPAYNEEANIGKLLESIVSQRLEKVKIKEIIIVASGCTDKTEEIVNKWQKNDGRINLIVQKQRKGKTPADNLFIKKAKSKILILADADTLLDKNCLENLVLPFEDPKIGATAGRIIPLNDKSNLNGYFSYLWWELFDKVAKDFFRAGEVMAFRNLGSKIPEEVGADEVYLTDEILAKGYQAKYVTGAIAYNMGPETIKDVILMRRRHACLHFQFKKFGPRIYYPKTMDNWYVFRLFLSQVNWLSAKESIFAIASAFLEALSRLLAYYDFKLGRKHLIWQRSQTTKRLLGLKKTKG